jgi:hypothetical protein
MLFFNLENSTENPDGTNFHNTRTCALTCGFIAGWTTASLGVDLSAVEMSGHDISTCTILATDSDRLSKRVQKVTSYRVDMCQN